MSVPTATSLKDIYPEDAIQTQVGRWEHLLHRFTEEYGEPPEFVARSPGRVNLIGEHIDYSLYSVLPLAITVDLILGVRVHPEHHTIRITNVNNTKFERREFELPDHGDPEIDHTTHEWTNYFKSGLRGVTELMKKRKGQQWRSVGMDIIVDGTVPSGGGLSSSAAFVCTSALAVMKANGEENVDKKELTELAIVSERAVGVNSGGMDQSASVFGEKGSALYISFKPNLTATSVSFPDSAAEIAFLVAQSFITSDKQVTAPIHYNLRVVECSIAACILAKIFGLKRGLPKDNGPLGVSLRGFHDTYFEEKEGVKDNTSVDSKTFEAQLDKLLHLVEDYLHQEDGYTREQICDVLGTSVNALQQQFESKFRVRADKFKLRQRAQHVFSEALRVSRFKELLVDPPQGLAGDQLAKDLGSLMNETQDSCRDLYECSCPELDDICKIARAAGAYGSRLTGAGWGGCSVHLVPKSKVEAVKKALTEKYYKKKWPSISEERLKEALVVSEPGAGSFLFKVTGEKVV